MKRLIISVEGQTEQEFIKNILCPYFAQHGIIDVRPIPIKKTGGGVVKYSYIRKDITNFICEKDVVVSTFIDYFKIPATFPGYESALEIKATDKRIESLEEAFGRDINSRNFIPYIQKHEFEALLYSSVKGFETFYEKNEVARLSKIIEKYPNPEDINNSPDTAPSKRLISIRSRYDKVTDGTIIAAKIGIEEILKKCPRFNAWVHKLIETTKE